MLLFEEQEGRINEIQELRNRIVEVLRQDPYMGESGKLIKNIYDNFILQSM